MSPCAFTTAAVMTSMTLGGVAAGATRIFYWNDIKKKIPKDMKVSPVAAIPHKSKAFQTILDLSFSLKLEPIAQILSVNKNSVKTAPVGAIDQLGHVLKQLIHAFAEAPMDVLILEAKWDITNGFWRIDSQKG